MTIGLITMHSTDNGIKESILDLSTIRIRATRGLIGLTNSSTASSSASSLSLSSPSSVATVTTASATIIPQGIKNCASCGKKITERFLLKAIDLFWHEDCLKCGCCDCRLGEVGSTLYTKANLILCRRDYLRLFGTTGNCAACNKIIPAFEMVMRAKNNVYHLECFACQQCNHRFCVGDRFYLCENKILCEYDYEERLVFANMAHNPSSLAHIRRQVSNLQTATTELLPPYPKNIIRSSLSSSSSLVMPSNGRQQILPHYNNSPLSPIYRTKTTTLTFNEKNFDELRQRPPTQPGSIRDDGSSGYGSPDSETFETPLSLPQSQQTHQ